MQIPRGLDEWKLHQQAEGHSPLTISERIRVVAVFGEHAGCDPMDAGTDHVISYLASLDVRPGTRATYFSYLRAWFLWLVRIGYRDDDPCIRMRSPKIPSRQPRPLSDQQLHAVLFARMHRRTRMMIYVATFEGLRVHEIAKLRGQEVDTRAEELRVIGKGGVDRTLPLHPLVAAMAIDFPTRGYWFSTHVGNHLAEEGPILPKSVSGIVGLAMRRAGVHGGAHRLRHTYATRLLDGGVNLRVVQELMRHASLQSTQIYTRVTFEQQREALHAVTMPSASPHTPDRSKSRHGPSSAAA